jgi:hypothetical protein
MLSPTSPCTRSPPHLRPRGSGSHSFPSRSSTTTAQPASPPPTPPHPRLRPAPHAKHIGGRGPAPRASLSAQSHAPSRLTTYASTLTQSEPERQGAATPSWHAGPRANRAFIGHTSAPLLSPGEVAFTRSDMEALALSIRSNPTPPFVALPMSTRQVLVRGLLVQNPAPRVLWV